MVAGFGDIPSMDRRTLALDPRYAGRLQLARALMSDATSGQPVRTPMEGLAKVLKGGVAGYFEGEVEREMEGRQKALRETLGQAFEAAAGAPAGFDPKTGITWDTARPGDRQMMARVLLGNPDTAGFGMQMALADADRAMAWGREDRLRDEDRTFRREEREAGERFQQGQQERQFGHAERMQGNQQAFMADQQQRQQEFTAGENALTRANQAALQASQQQFTAGENEKNRQLQQDLKAVDQKLATAKTTFDRENTLRDEFNNLTKDHRTVQDAYQKITKTSNTGAGDMSMLYSYVKLLDPGSVVRESEFATAAASGSFGERIQGLAQRILSGQRLPDSLRQSFLAEAKSIYEAQMRGYDTLLQNYMRLATKYGIDPANVTQDYRQSNASGATPQGATAGIPEPPAGFKVVN